MKQFGPRSPNSVWERTFLKLRFARPTLQNRAEADRSFFEQKETKATKKIHESTAKKILRSLRFLLFSLISEVSVGNKRSWGDEALPASGAA